MNIEDEWLDWYGMTPSARWKENDKLWTFYIEAGGTLDSEPDTQSPFYTARSRDKISSHGRSGMHILRRSGI